MEKVKSDKDAGLREGMLSLSSKLGASGKKAGGAAGGRKNCSLQLPLRGKLVPSHQGDLLVVRGGHMV